MKTNDEKQKFYENVSNILGIEHTYREPLKVRNRWTNRRIGNGRYPGFGLIQCFGSYVRVIQRGKSTKIFRTYEEVYDYLKNLQLD